MMKKFTAIMMALMMVLTLTQCKPDKGNEGDTQNGSKVKVSCVVPINKGAKSEFDNLMTDGTIKWSAGTERIYLAIPDETNPQIVELTAFTTVESNILAFEGEVAEGLVKDGEYEVWYLGNSKNLDIPYVTEEIEDEVIKSISGSIASQSGNLNDLGYCHIAMTTVTAETEGEKVVLSLNGTLKNQIAIAHLDLEGITQLKGDAIVGTDYALQYKNGAFEFAVTPDAKANVNVTEGTSASYVVLFPNATANVDLKSNTSKKVTFEGGVEANKIYYKHVSDMEFYPLTWEDYEENLINGHEYVDLGLPSGLLWATCNVGANSPEEYGDYFAWGETETKSEYTQANSLTYKQSMSNSISGYPKYDVATANWGSKWRMPTKNEMQELIDNCTWTLIMQNGVNGYKVTGSNGKYIFIPAAGSINKTTNSNEGIGFRYWTSIPSAALYDAYAANFTNTPGIRGISRYYGASVRAVSAGVWEGQDYEITTNGEENGYEYVDLGLSVKWATCNVGANLPEEYGNYYAWGETEIKDSYTQENSITYNEKIYIISGNAQYDAATANWGGNWRMPKVKEMEELVENCTWYFTTYNGCNGYVAIGPSGNCIFLPAAGYRSEESLIDVSEGYYWSSETFDGMYTHSTILNVEYLNQWDDVGFVRSMGLTIRPVID